MIATIVAPLIVWAATQRYPSRCRRLATPKPICASKATSTVRIPTIRSPTRIRKIVKRMNFVTHRRINVRRGVRMTLIAPPAYCAIPRRSAASSASATAIATRPTARSAIFSTASTSARSRTSALPTARRARMATGIACNVSVTISPWCAQRTTRVATAIVRMVCMQKMMLEMSAPSASSDTSARRGYLAPVRKVAEISYLIRKH